MNNVVIKDFVKDLVNEGILYSVVCGNYDLYFVANDNKLHIEKNGDEIWSVTEFQVHREEPICYIILNDNEESQIATDKNDLVSLIKVIE